MISLLLTLFISLFSIGSNFNTIDKPLENIAYIDSSKPVNNANINDQYSVFGVDELANEFYYGQLMEYNRIYCGLDSESGWVDYQWMVPTNCELSFITWSQTYQPLLNTQNVLARHETYSFYDIIYIINYEFVSANNWNVYGFYMNRVTDYGAYLYYTYGVHFTYNGSNIYELPSNLFTVTSNLDRSLGLYIPRYTIQSSDLILVNPYYEMLSATTPTENSYNQGYDMGYTNGYDQGNYTGYQDGYNDGLDMADQGTATEIFTGIATIGLLPVNVFLKIFEFEVFGINISGLVGGLLTIAVVVIIIRFLLGERGS